LKFFWGKPQIPKLGSESDSTMLRTDRLHSFEIFALAHDIVTIYSTYYTATVGLRDDVIIRIVCCCFGYSVVAARLSITGCQNGDWEYNL